MQVLTTLAELDAKLAECEAAAAISDDALRQVFQTFRMDFSTSLPPDPFSAEYRRAQMDLYERIAQRRYSLRNEESAFVDAEAADRRPFPYCNQSMKTTGHSHLTIGFMLQCFDLEPGARVVEFGSGWGNSTIAMAMNGLDVTAVDIEPRFCELLRRRARRHDVELAIVNSDFMWSESVNDPFDAAVFLASFHHCDDHMRLLRALRKAVKPGGRIYFAAEPINAEFSIPWGLRLDGESLWAVRSFGWMELGYNDGYFREALARTGWEAKYHPFDQFGWLSVWEARRTPECSVHGPPASGRSAVEDPSLAPPLPEIEGLRHEQRESDLTLGRESMSDKVARFADLDYSALMGDPPISAEPPATIRQGSRLCRQGDLATDAFRYWMHRMHEPILIHRKYWEWYFIADALYQRGMLAPGMRGVGFGVGLEPLPSLFASFGVMVMATDMAENDAVSAGWATSGQHASGPQALNQRGLCDDESFRDRVSYRIVNMNKIPDDFDGKFDFCWSSCAFEHLGSLEHGLRFVERASSMLRPGGISVHTTEYNMSSNEETFEHPDLSVYRRRDIECLIVRLKQRGHHVEPIDWRDGPGIADKYVDLPPYSPTPFHLRLQIASYVCTSVGLVIRCNPAGTGCAT